MAYYFTRQALYDLVWKEPRQQLAKRFQISDVGLAKICAKSDIPMPPRGYWAKKEAGKPTTKVALPLRGLGQSDRVVIGRLGYADPSNDDRAPLPDAPVFSEPLDVIRERAQKMLGKVRLTSLQKDAHRLIAAVLEEDGSRRKEMEQNRYAWKKPVFDSADGKRRLRLLNALFLAFARAGCLPTLRGMEELEPGVGVGDTHVSFKLEPLSSSRAAARGQQQSQRMKLKLTVNRWRDKSREPELLWEDRDDASLEDQLTDIASGLLAAAEMQYRAGVLRQYQWLVAGKAAAEEALRKKREEEERIALQKKLELQQKQRDWLFQQAAGLRQAAEIRALVAAMEDHPQINDENATALDFQLWRSWALSIASELDPRERPLEEVIARYLP